jgi:hypothetical protein
MLGGSEKPRKGTPRVFVEAAGVFKLSYWDSNVVKSKCCVVVSSHATSGYAVVIHSQAQIVTSILACPATPKRDRNKL